MPCAPRPNDQIIAAPNRAGNIRIEHEIFFVSVDIYRAEKPIQKRGVDTVLCGEIWHLVGLDCISSRLKLSD